MISEAVRHRSERIGTGWKRQELIELLSKLVLQRTQHVVRLRGMWLLLLYMDTLRRSGALGTIGAELGANSAGTPVTDASTGPLQCPALLLDNSAGTAGAAFEFSGGAMAAAAASGLEKTLAQMLDFGPFCTGAFSSAVLPEQHGVENVGEALFSDAPATTGRQLELLRLLFAAARSVGNAGVLPDRQAGLVGL